MLKNKFRMLKEYIKKIMTFVLILFIVYIIAVAVDSIFLGDFQIINDITNDVPPIVIEEDNNNLDDALSSAKKYIDNEPMSRDKLYYALLQDNFSNEAILYALENIEVDWNAECVEYTEHILGKDYYSESSLIYELADEEYTRDEINNAIDTLNIDWQNEAVQCANACRLGGFSEIGIRINFYNLGFNEDLTNYALETVEYNYVEECETRISYFMDINDLDEESTRYELKADGFDEECIEKAFEMRNKEK